MKLSTKGRYGLRAMVDLAVHGEGGHVAVSGIAERQGISGKYLEQIFSSLRKAGLVKSVKGAQGGYVLADKASNITVGAVLRALEGDLAVVDEAPASEAAEINSIEYCIKLHVWDKMAETLNRFVDSLTLEDLAGEYRKMSGTENNMYYI